MSTRERGGHSHSSVGSGHAWRGCGFTRGVDTGVVCEPYGKGELRSCAPPGDDGAPPLRCTGDEDDALYSCGLPTGDDSRAGDDDLGHSGHRRKVLARGRDAGRTRHAGRE
jgi:hypothetical protein